MNRYRAQTIFSGFKINKKTDDKFVAVSQKKLNHTCMVTFGDKYMIVKKGTKPAYTEEFEDKFGRDPYKMCYFKWVPFKKKERAEEDFVTIKNAMQGMPEEYREKLRKLFKK